MIVEESEKKHSAEPSPKDAQKGGQGAVGNPDKGAELNQKGHPGPAAGKN